MRLAGDIPIQRGFGPSAVEAIARCREVLANRVSVMIFPEGTRSTTADLLPFKDGAFRLAIDAGVPILPLVVHGTSTALPKHDWRFGRSTAVVRVLEPVETAGLGPADVTGAQGPGAEAHRRGPGGARGGAARAAEVSGGDGWREWARCRRHGVILSERKDRVARASAARG